MTSKRVILLVGAMAASAADMHPICQRFADQEVPAKFPAQYICFSEHSKGSGGFCLSMLEWYTNGELWSSAYDIGSGTNDAEQAPIILANRRGSLLDDTVSTCWVCDATARLPKEQHLRVNWFDCGMNMSVFCGSVTGPDHHCEPSSGEVFDEALVGDAKTRTAQRLGGLTTAATKAVGRGHVHAPRHKHATVEHGSRNLTIKAAANFLDLAQERFAARWGRPPTREEEQWALDRLQLLRVPKAGSSQASVVARRLGGCMPRGPCCRYPGNPVGSCPAEGLTCHTVAGCTSHSVGGKKRRLLRDPSVFSMSNLRDVVDRLVSGFFYTAPHSPACAQQDKVDYERCFLEMVHNPIFQNVASRMFSGNSAYDGDVRLCLHEGPECDVTLPLVVRGACSLNFITMCEAPTVSMLLLFEILPQLGPSHDFFPMAVPGHSVRRKAQITSRTQPPAMHDGLGSSRQNTGDKHAEGIRHITLGLRKRARHANAVDVSLHHFVSAKFCDLLQQLDLVGHPLVLKELSTYHKLGKRCRDAAWIAATLDRFKPITPDDCRLYQPFARPGN